MNAYRGIWRGKRKVYHNYETNKDVFEWVEGFLVEVNANNGVKCFIITNARWDSDDNSIDFLETTVYEVDPSTLGECTGLTDKNGNKIFEGDVLSNKLPDPELFLCYYCDEEAGFYAKNVRTHSVYMLGALMDMTLFKLEIIGNIHDNPELIQKGAAE